MSKVDNKHSQNNGFSKWRSLLWPIHQSETKRFLLLSLVMCCILFIYTACRNIKDTQIVSLEGGAAMITFLKLYFVTPAAILGMMGFTYINNKFNREQVFYCIVIPFLIFFASFVLFLHPYAHILQPSSGTLSRWIAAAPNLGGFLRVFGNWIYALFFVMAELWGTFVLSIAFWGFANLVTPMSMAKRFYGMFSVIGNLAVILSGVAVSSASKVVKLFLPVGSSSETVWSWTLNLLMFEIVSVGLISIIIFRYLNANIISKDPVQEGSAKPKKQKLGFIDSLKVILKNKHLGLIVMLVISYGVSINLLEVQWKNQVALRFMGDKSAMNAFFGRYSMWTGVVTVFFAWFVGSNILRIFGWMKSALFTPAVILFAGSAFFAIVLGVRYAPEIVSSLVSNPAVFASISGAAIVIISKASKYCLFDPTKEMSYIPLEDELRSKGKAAVDGVGGRLGKSGGALVQSTLLLLMGTSDVLEIVSIAFTVFIMVCIVWLFSVKRLGKVVEAYERQEEACESKA